METLNIILVFVMLLFLGSVSAYQGLNKHVYFLNH